MLRSITTRARRLLRPLVGTPGDRFDRRGGVKTEVFADLDDLTVQGDVSTGFLHVPTPPRLAWAWLDALGAPPEGYTFIDMGSGVGRVLLLASTRPFARVVGVEFAVELHQAAVENIALFPRSRMRCRDVASVNQDATVFAFPPGPLVVFFNNPFSGEVMTRVVANLESSYREDPRPVIVVYQQLTDEDPEHRTDNMERLDRCGFLTGDDVEFDGRDRDRLGHYRVRIYRSAEAIGRHREPGPAPG